MQQEFVQLIAQHQKLIHSLCSLYYQLPEDRKDLFQEIVLQLWKSYPSFNHQSKVSTWIYRVALNTVFARIRKDKAQPERVPFSEQEFLLPSSETDDDETQGLYRAISQLSDVDKAIIMLYLDEHSYEEMATILAMSRTNVSTKINRIKARLGKLLKKEPL
ncbi:sigma-70 family RNA polymerase sigma factor [Larkinella punicea]|uniref:Sigma-70 family RNA polymerase sigma factor n=1 Tax=Larkinella punicea TaxID=2315727 RepID=A0A368JXP2_9BACT|nr:sigma-70 family RNA polymerase sigma factor [Larkinella punicea]